MLYRVLSARDNYAAPVFISTPTPPPPHLSTPQTHTHTPRKLKYFDLTGSKKWDDPFALPFRGETLKAHFHPKLSDYLSGNMYFNLEYIYLQNAFFAFLTGLLFISALHMLSHYMLLTILVGETIKIISSTRAV